MTPEPTVQALHDTRRSPETVRREAASARGKANSEKGKRAERDLVGYLRARGWPGAERTVRTGHRTPGRVSADRGDIDGTIGLAWQAKDVSDGALYQVPTWLDDVNAQRAAAGADIGVLVVKRRGHADPGDWWAWLTLDDVVHPLTTNTLTGYRYPAALFVVPVRLAVGDLVPILHYWGYGTCDGRDGGCACDGCRV